jgi:PhnB protein
MAVKPIPEGYRAITPYLTVDDLPRMIQYAIDAFGAVQTEGLEDADGKVRHAEIRIGDSVLMLGQARKEWPSRPATLYFYVEDCDAVYSRAIAAGGKSLMEPVTAFYGDRSGGVEDPLGNYWWIATHVEDVPPEEMERRAREQMK